MIKIFTKLLFVLTFINSSILHNTYAQIESGSTLDWTKNTFKKDAKVVNLLQKVDELVLNKMRSSTLYLQKENYSKLSGLESNELRNFLLDGYYIKADTLLNYENSYIVIDDVTHSNMQPDSSELDKFSVYLLPNPSSCLDARYLQDINKGMIFWPNHPPRYLPKGNTDEERALNFKRFVDFENTFSSRSMLKLDKKYGEMILGANKKMCLIRIGVEILKEPLK